MEPSEVLIEIGQQLNEARIRRRLTVDDLSTQLKIRREYLLALERGDWQALPEEIYAQGFLRSYARALDLDADHLVQLRRSILQGRPSGPPAVTEKLETTSNLKIPESHRRSHPFVGSSRRSRSGGRNGSVVSIIAALFVIFLGISWLLTTAHPKRTGTSVADSTSAPPSARGHAVGPPASPSSSPASSLVSYLRQTRSGSVVTFVYQVSDSPIQVQLHITGQCWLEAWSNGAVVNAGTTYYPGQSVSFQGQNSVKLLLGNSGGVNVSVSGDHLGLAGPSGAVRALNFQVGSGTSSG